MKIKKHWWFIGGGLLLVLFVVAGLARPKPGKKVQVAMASRQKLVSLVKAPASIEPKTLINVSAEVPGKIVQLAVEEGQAVRRGQLLLRLDPSNYEEDVRQAQAMLSSAEARLRGAKSAWDTAQPTHKRRQALFEQKLLSAGEMEAADREYQGALSEYEAAREEVARTRAALRGARDRYAKTVFNSPITGTITDLNVEEGEIVITGTMNNPGTRILSVGDLDRMLAKADVDETDVIDLRVGQKATIEVDAFPDTSFPAHVSEIAHSAKTSGSTGTSGETDFEVKVLFDERVPRVRPGMTADVSIETASKDSALAVPIQSVVTRSEDDLKKATPKRGGRAAAEAENAAAASGKKTKAKDKTGVFVLVAGKAEFREVTTGIASETDIEVSGNLKPGEQIITGPYQVLRDLKPGQRVIVEKPGARGAQRRG